MRSAIADLECSRKLVPTILSTNHKIDTTARVPDQPRNRESVYTSKDQGISTHLIKSFLVDHHQLPSLQGSGSTKHIIISWVLHQQGTNIRTTVPNSGTSQSQALREKWSWRADCCLPGYQNFQCLMFMTERCLDYKALHGSNSVNRSSS